MEQSSARGETGMYLVDKKIKEKHVITTITATVCETKAIKPTQGCKLPVPVLCVFFAVFSHYHHILNSTICDPPYDFRGKGDHKLATCQHEVLRVFNIHIQYF